MNSPTSMRHGPVPLAAAATVVLVAERHAGLQQPNARAVHVLVFVDQDMIVQALELGGDLRAGLEQLDRQGNQIAEVHGIAIPFQVLVEFVDAGVLG